MSTLMLPSAIIEALNNKGAQEFDDLFKMVQKIHNDINQNDFNKILMEMELQGIIRVSKLARGKRRIEAV
jgi:Ca2+-binding EF-hand superfamily protein